MLPLIIIIFLNKLKRWWEITKLKVREALFKRKYFCIQTSFNNGFQYCLPERSLWRVKKGKTSCMLSKMILRTILKVSAPTLWNLRSAYKRKKCWKYAEYRMKEKVKWGDSLASPTLSVVHLCICFWANSLKINAVSLFLKCFKVGLNIDRITNLMHPLF